MQKFAPNLMPAPKPVYVQGCKKQFESKWKAVKRVQQYPIAAFVIDDTLVLTYRCSRFALAYVAYGVAPLTL
jgi:hypothetical protein